MATQLATRADNPLGVLKTQIEERAREFQAALPSHISPEKFQRTILTAVQADPELLKASRKSLILAAMKAAQDGLLPDKREAAFVIFKKNFKDAQGAWQQALEVQYMPMVYGLRKKILQSKEVTDIKPNVVYRREVEEGHFIYEEGTEAMLRHKPMFDLTDEEAADENIVIAYSVATYTDGTKSYEVMRRFEINKVQNCSQTGALFDKKGKPRTPSGPWVDWYPEQAKKTVMRRHSKTLPQSGDLVDVEGNELDQQRASLSALGALGAGEPIDAAPRAAALPGADELVDETVIDHATGEIIDHQEGRTDEQHGDQNDGDESDANAPYAATVSDLLERIAQAGTVIDAKAMEKDWQAHMEALPDAENARIDAALSERIEQLKAK